ncbi:hypothetical protein MTX20_15080 [Bradyrhizobium sp. ISRA435]|nr:hypothetical protein MTX20_15080 [Bradyrhizobium sp. ISRA435]
MIEAAVFPVPHERLGADVAAAVVLRQDARSTHKVSETLSEDAWQGLRSLASS